MLLKIKKLWRKEHAFLGTLLALTGAGVVNLHAALDYPYEYDFISSDPGVSGKLFLDQSSSASGSAADIGPSSYLTFNLYNGYLPPVTFALGSLNTSLDPSLTFDWTASQITTPIDFAVGSGQNDVLLNREFQDPNNHSFFAPEYDAVEYASIHLGAGQNLLNKQVLSSSIVSLVATEETMNVGGGGLVYDLPFDPGTSRSMDRYGGCPRARPNCPHHRLRCAGLRGPGGNQVEAECAADFPAKHVVPNPASPRVNQPT